MPSHHPDDSSLIEYAAGSLTEAKALLVATHLALCPTCRAGVRSGEVVGCVLAFTDVEETALESMPDVATVAMERSKLALSSAGVVVPEPLRGYLGVPIGELPWASAWWGMKAYVLPEFAGRSTGVRLLAIEPGRRMPRHTHENQELTLVLQGSFSDSTGDYGTGDVAIADNTIDHQPKASKDGLCLCLAVEDAPPRLTGWTGDLINAAVDIRRILKL